MQGDGEPRSSLRQ